MARQAEEYHSNANDKPLDPNEIPQELRTVAQWMGTRFKRREDGKLDKPPYRVRRGQRIIKADKTNPENWTTFEEALAAYERGEVDAIGYVFCEDDPFFCVDLDKILDAETGEIAEAAARVIHALDSYAELSCSSTGVHIIGAGEKPGSARCKTRTLGFDVEVYDRKRFLVMTGRTIGRNRAPQERQGELDALCRKLWPREKANPPKRPLGDTGPVDLEDAVLLERARTARSGPKFHKLYDLGDTSGYDSHSNADYALLNSLIFWTAGDRDRIIGLFEASALYRKQGKHRNYAALSTDNALASYVGPFYKPRLTREVREEEDHDPLTPYLRLLLDPSAWAGRKGASALKAYAAMVVLAQEHGIVDDEGGLRIGCDIRRLAEVAGVSLRTLSTSTLPHLIQEMKLLKWKRGKGTQSGTFLLPPPPQGRARYNTKVRGYFSVEGYAPPKNALETLRLLIRMRYGYAKTDTLLKLGMPAMFVAVALASSPNRVRGYSAEELAERTGRRKRDLEAAEGPLRRLKAAAVVQETTDGFYRFTAEFAANYERALEHSGITYAEREQRRRHARDRQARNAKLQTDKRTSRLRGKEQMRRLLKRKQEAAKRRGEAPAQAERKKSKDTPAPGEIQHRIDRLIREGRSPRWARREVLAPDHPLRCGCEVCGG